MNESVPLREYIEALLREKDKRDEQRFQSIEEKAVAANEWREAMNDRERMFVPRAEHELANRALTGRVDTIENRARTGVWGWVVGAVGLAVSLVAIFTMILKATK